MAIEDDILAAVQDLQSRLTVIEGKLPTNNFMGSSVKTDKDDEIGAILEDTGTTLPASIALVSTASSITTLIQQTSGQTNVYDERT